MAEAASEAVALVEEGYEVASAEEASGVAVSGVVVLETSGVET